MRKDNPKRSGLKAKASRTDLDQIEFDMTKKVSKTAKVVMKKIKSKKLKMKPRAYFVLGSMLMGVGIVGVLLITVFLTSAIFFRLRMGGAMDYLGFGRPGLRFFVRSFPWKVIGLALISFLGGSWMLKKHDKAYKVSLGWLVLGAVITVVGLGFFVDKVGVNERLEKRRELKSLYDTRFEGREEMLEELRLRSPRPHKKMMKPRLEEVK
jgi:hypothetical protein